MKLFPKHIPDEQLVRPRERLEDPETWKHERAQHFRSDTVLIPALAASEGIYFEKQLVKTLQGEGQTDDRDTTGLGRASRKLGEIINGKKRDRIEDLFVTDTLATRKVPLVEDGKTYMEDEFVLPDFEKLAQNPYAGEAGTLFFGMLQDIVKPYEPQPADGFAVLPARAAYNAYKTRVYKSADETDARLCSNAEDHFSNRLKSSSAEGLTELSVDGETVALQKRDGEHTAVLVKPAVLNGVRLPVGSIMIVETDQAGKTRFAFGRLSAFCFEEPAVAKREFASVFAKEKKLTQGRFNDFSQAMRNFNGLVGRSEEIDARAAIDAYLERVNSWDVKGTAQHLMHATEQAILEDQVARIMLQNDARADRAAEVAYYDKQAQVAGGFEQDSDPKKREAALQAVVRERLNLARTFGQPAVDKARRLIDLNADLPQFI